MYIEEISNFIKESEKIDELFAWIDAFTVEDLMREGPGRLRETLEKIEKCRKEILTVKLWSEHRIILKNKLGTKESKLQEALKRLTEITADVLIDVPQRNVEVGQEFKTGVELINKSPFTVIFELHEPELKGLSLKGSFKREIAVGAYSRHRMELTMIAKEVGKASVGPLRISCRSGDKRKEMDSGIVKVNVVELPRISVEKKVDRESVIEGDVINVKIIVQNKGGAPVDITLTDDVQGLVDGETSWSSKLNPGEEKTISYRVRGERNVSLLQPATVTCKDYEGRMHVFTSNSVAVRITPKEEIQPIVEGSKPPPPVDAKFVAEEILKMGLFSLIGYWVAGKREVKVPKKVLIEGLRYVEKEKFTYVLENPLAVVREEHDDIVRLRRANPTELLSAVDAWTAKRLEEVFIAMMEGMLSTWKPQETIGTKLEKRSIDTQELEELKLLLKKQGEKLDEKKVEKLPRNQRLHYRYYEGRVFKKTMTEVHAFSHSRIKKLYFYDVDHAPIGIHEVMGMVKSLSSTDHPVMIFIGSPTGWAEEAKKFAKEYEHLETSLALVDLKTFELYYNENSKIGELAKRIEERIKPASISLYMTFDQEEERTLEKLDDLLLNETINQEEYVKRLENLFIELKRKNISIKSKKEDISLKEQE